MNFETTYQVLDRTYASGTLAFSQLTQTPIALA